MNCGFCGKKTRVVDSRPKDENTIWRRRLCDNCGIAFSTYEAERPAVVVISDDQLVEIHRSLKRGVAHYIIAQLTGVSIDAIHQIAASMELPNAVGRKRTKKES